MGYTGPGFITRPDLSRQIYQSCGTYAHLSGSTQIDQSLQVWLSGACSTVSGGTYGFTVTGTSGNTVVVAIGQKPDTTIGKSGFQINPSLIITGGLGYADLEIDLTTGEIAHGPSSLRYKKDVEDLKYETYKNILNLTPVSFKWKETNKNSIGFIAEEAHELGLNKFVTYNINGQPEAINYKLLTVAIIGILKHGVTPTLISTPKEDVEDIPITIVKDYVTTTTRYIIAKKDLTITLDDGTLKRFYIKSMANITIVPSDGLIDEEWEEIEMGPQSSIELIAHNGNWYVLSSDGLKNS
jgi:hypothetical protein